MLAVTIGLFVYLLGLCVGSFLNVVVYRLPRGLSIWEPTWSFCPDCRKTLKWYDNVPVLSWLLLRARCRYCGKPISSQYPLVEAVTGLAFVNSWAESINELAATSDNGADGSPTTSPGTESDGASPSAGTSTDGTSTSSSRAQ